MTAQTLDGGITYLCAIASASSLSPAEADSGLQRVPGAYARAIAEGRVRTSLTNPALALSVLPTFADHNPAKPYMCVRGCSRLAAERETRIRGPTARRASPIDKILNRFLNAGKHPPGQTDTLSVPVLRTVWRPSQCVLGAAARGH
jgi:hypothetical protein